MGKVHLPPYSCQKKFCGQNLPGVKVHTLSLSLFASELPTRIHQTSGGNKCFNPSVAINFVAIICPEGNRFL